MGEFGGGGGGGGVHLETAMSCIMRAWGMNRLCKMVQSVL